MLIFLLATVMTVAMLIATAFGLHGEVQAVRLETQREKARRYRLGG